MAQRQLVAALLGPIRLELRYPGWEFFPSIRKPCPIEWIGGGIVLPSEFAGAYREALAWMEGRRR
jgi:hypothetical protein